VWTETGTIVSEDANSGVEEVIVVPNKFLAAEIAGLRTAVLPQQGLTRTEIQTVTNAPAMHTQYTPELLDEIASSGTFIITQEIEHGPMYIRHQLTTRMDKGSLYYEDSVGVNLDNISFHIDDYLETFIGKFNVTRETIAMIHDGVETILDGFTKADIKTSIGPALIGYEDLVVKAHDIYKDRILVDATLFMPLPLNNIIATLRATVDVNL
jgi:hypothetical protein